MYANNITGYNMTNEQRNKIEVLIPAMVAIARPVGSMHSWWQLINELQMINDGKQLSRPIDYYINEAEIYFSDSGLDIPKYN